MELHWQQKQTRQGQWLGKVKWEGGGGRRVRLPEEMKETGEERGQCGEATCLDGLMALKWHLFPQSAAPNVP